MPASTLSVLAETYPNTPPPAFLVFLAYGAAAALLHATIALTLWLTRREGGRHSDDNNEWLIWLVHVVVARPIYLCALRVRGITEWHNLAHSVEYVRRAAAHRQRVRRRQASWLAGRGQVRLAAEYLSLMALLPNA